MSAWGEEQRERERESSADSVLSMEPNAGLRLMTGDYHLSRNQVRHLADCTTQAPHDIFFKL